MSNIDFTHKTIENQTAGISVSKTTFQPVFDAIRKIVDKSYRGSTEKLDADLCGGSEYTAADVLAKLKTVDGPGSGLDAGTATGSGIGGGRSGITDFNTIDGDGVIFRTTDSAAHAPGAEYFNGWQVYVNSDSLYRTQFAISLSGKIYVRIMSGGVWGGWAAVWSVITDGNGGQQPAPKARRTSIPSVPTDTWTSILSLGTTGKYYFVFVDLGIENQNYSLAGLVAESLVSGSPRFSYIGTPTSYIDLQVSGNYLQVKQRSGAAHTVNLIYMEIAYGN